MTKKQIYNNNNIIPSLWDVCLYALYIVGKISDYLLFNFLISFINGKIPCLLVFFGENKLQKQIVPGPYAKECFPSL